MVNMSALRRWIWAVLLVELSMKTPVSVLAAAASTPSADHEKPQRLRKKKHFRQSRNEYVIVDQVEQAKQHSEEAVQQAANQFHTPEPSAAYVKCRSMLEGVAGDDMLVDKSEYVQFVFSLTGGKVNADSFDALQGRWATIFYRTACGQMRGQCDGDDVAFELNDTMENYEQVVAFCDAVMEHATTTASLTFGYSIQYNTESISEVSNDSAQDQTEAHGTLTL